MKKSNTKWLLFFICLVLFLFILEDVFDNEIMVMDVNGYQFISDNFINENLTPIMKGITLLGSATFFIPFIIFLLIFIKNNYLRLSISINIILITLLNQILKFVIQRPRPTQYRIVDASGYSFPSGHSMVSMAFYGFLIYLIYRYLKNKYLKTILILILSVVIVLIGISRIYLGVHYTSDVCAGFLLSLSYLIVYIHYIENWLNEKAAN